MRALRQLFPRASEYGDQLIVTLLAATALVEVLVSGESVLDAVVGAAVALPLLARRRAPLLVLGGGVAPRLARHPPGGGGGGAPPGRGLLHVPPFHGGAARGRPRGGAPGRVG